MSQIRHSTLTLALVAASAAASAAPVGVDGVIGAEWIGATVRSIAYDSAAATSNFSSPGTSNHVVGYNVYYRADSSHLYVGLEAVGDTTGLNFANLYFNTDLIGGSDFGIEVTNNQAFRPGVAGYFGLSGYLTFAQSVGSTNHVIEMALDWNYLATDPDSILPDALSVSTGVQLRSVQAFGYSVTGGDLAGGTRFGTVSQPATAAVPLPGSLALAGLALAALAHTRRRTR